LLSSPISGVDKVIQGQLFPIKIRLAPVPTPGDQPGEDNWFLRTSEDNSIINLGLQRAARRAERLSDGWGKAVCENRLMIECSRISVHGYISDCFRQSEEGKFLDHVLVDHFGSNRSLILNEN